MLNSAYIEYNGTLNSISKSSPEYKKLIDKGTLFKYKGTYKYRNKDEYFAFLKDNVTFYFPKSCFHIVTQRPNAQFVISHEYFFKSDIDPEMLDLVQIYEDDKMRKIKKNQPEYEILRNPQSLFLYSETLIDKNGIEFLVFNNGNTKYCFPRYDKKGVQFDFYKYAGDYSVPKQVLEYTVKNYSYIDTERAIANSGVKLTTTNLLYNRFLKLTLKTIELAEDQSVQCLFVVGDNEFSVSYKQFMDVYNKILVSNSKIHEFHGLQAKVEKYKSFFKYIDLQLATSVSIKDSSNLVCGRFYPIDIKEVVSTEDWEPLIVFSIDGEEQSVNGKYVLETGASLDIVTQCKDFYNYIESTKQEYKYINVFGRMESTSLRDTSLLYGKFAPIIDLKGLFSSTYKEFVEVKCESNKFDMVLPVTDFRKNAYMLNMVEGEKEKYDEVVEQFETTKRNYVYYLLDDGQMLPMEVLDAEINENYEIVEYYISINSSEQNVFADEFNQYAITKEEYFEELEREKQAQEEERRRIAQAQEEERKNAAFFSKNLKGYIFYRVTDFATYLSSQANDFGLLLLSAGISGISNDAFFITEGYVFVDNNNGAFMVDFDYDKNKVRMTNTSDLQGYLQVASLAADLKESTVFTYKISGNQLIMTGETTSNSGRKYHFSKTLIYNEKDHTLREGNVIYKRRRVE